MIYDIRKKIQDIQLELGELEDPISDIPELINSTNLLRSNEYLSKLSKKQSELLSVYDQYAKSLEEMIDLIFEIQDDLKNLLKAQSHLIPDQKTKSKNKKKSATKSRKK